MSYLIYIFIVKSSVTFLRFSSDFLKKSLYISINHEFLTGSSPVARTRDERVENGLEASENFVVAGFVIRWFWL
ncbi:MAG: hypothetical protein JXR56_01880, partial [Candidatus Cloacimonetes bacterium]|nr:hypothetical protein [Candidatus Cloacimonadota bacterium]